MSTPKYISEDLLDDNLKAKVNNGGGGGGGGDMYKSTYDSNNDGKVNSADSADSVAWSGITNKPTSTAANIDSAVTNSHTHSNKSLLDTYTQSEANLSDAVSKKHSNANDHTHSNKNLLDTYSQTETDLADAVSKKHSNTNDHTHSNKSTLDTYTQTETNLADAVSKKHDVSYLGTKQVDETAIADGKVLQYSSGSGKLVYATVAGGGGGDMYKSTYDTDNDGKVESADSADSVPWSGVTGKPTMPSGTIVGTTDTQTLTNKTISGSSNTFSNISADSTVDGSTNKVYTGTEKTKLSGIEVNANNYSHPSTHSADIITDGSTNKVLTSTMKSNYDTAYTNNHTHSNKSLLDTYTQSETNLADAVSKKHDVSYLGTKQVDEANIADTKVLAYNSTSGKLEYVSAGAGSDSKKVLISSGDTTEDYLINKLVAGTNITLTKQNTGANENIKIDASGGSSNTVNIQTLSGDKTLTAGTDANNQFLQTGSANRNVTLATGVATGSVFTIMNNNAYNSSYYLEIKQSTTTITRLYAGAIASYIFNGTDWKPNSNGAGGLTTDEQYNVSIGYKSIGSSAGTAVGSESNADTVGVAVGRSTNASTYGATIGYSSNGSSYGASVGNCSNGSSNGAAIGYYAKSNSKDKAFAKGYYSQCERYREEWKCSDGASTNKYGNGVLAWYGATTDATQTEIYLGGTASNRATVLASSAFMFKLYVVAYSNATTEGAVWEITGGIRRDGSNNTTLIGTPVKTQISNDSGVTTWDVTVSADDTNEALKIQVTGEASHTIRWHVTGYISECRF